MKPIVGTENKIIFQVEEEQTKTGLILPKGVETKPKFGRVVKVTDIDLKGQPPVLKENDLVIISTSPGSQIEKFEYQGEDYYVTKESNIIAVL